MELREHQEKAIEMIREAFREGHKKVLLAACCSFGKTHTAAFMAKQAMDSGRKVAFFADRVRLVSQTLKVFDEWGIHYGVQQADHWAADPKAPVQICSVQTITRRGYDRLDFELAIWDECHVPWKSLTEMMAKWDGPKMHFVGLSATPYSKGLGLIWDKMIVPVRQAELLEQGYLAPVHYYGGRSVDVSKLRTKALGTGGSDYDPDALAEAVEADDKLTGDIVRNWLEHGENAQTIAFSPSIKHSEFMVKMFNDHGIPARHIDGYTKEKERKEIYRAHEAGEFKILSCSKLLGVGYDSPQTRCLIDCYGTKSAIAYQQRAGRIQRTHPDKPYGIYLDHSGNVNRFGFAHLMEPSELDMKEKRFSEAGQIEKKEKKDDVVRDCPRCGKIMQGLSCVCGFKITIREALESDGTMLVKLDDSKPQQVSKETKSLWMASLSKYGKEQGYKDGWAAWTYKKKFGVWPRSLDRVRVETVPPEVINFIISRNIANAKRKRY
jgi:superfamily II DNA or RNA helicase